MSEYIGLDMSPLEDGAQPMVESPLTNEEFTQLNDFIWLLVINLGIKTDAEVIREIELVSLGGC